MARTKTNYENDEIIVEKPGAEVLKVSEILAREAEKKGFKKLSECSDCTMKFGGGNCNSCVPFRQAYLTK